MVLSRPGFNPNVFETLAREMLPSFNERTASNVATLRVWSPTMTSFGVRRWSTNVEKAWTASLDCLGWKIGNAMVAKQFPSTAGNRLVFWYGAGSFLMEKITINTEHILKGDVVTYDFLTEKLFLSQKYNLMSVITENVHKKVNFPNCKKLYSYFALPCALNISPASHLNLWA